MKNGGKTLRCSKISAAAQRLPSANSQKGPAPGRKTGRGKVWGRQDHCWSSMPLRSWPPLQLSSDTARSTSPWRNQTPATSAPCPHCTTADGSQCQVYRLLQRFPLKEKKPCLICKCIWVSICLPRNPGSEKPFLCGPCGDFTGYRLPRKQRVGDGN